MKEQSLSLIDIYGVVHNPWYTQPFMVIFIVMVSGIVFGFCVYRLYHASWFAKKMTVVQQLQQKLLPLQQIQDDDQQLIHEAYFTLTGVIKEVIGYFYQIELQDKTDSEIQEEILKLLPQEQSFLLIDLLKRAFMVKFAYQHQNSEQLRSDIEVVQTLIKSLSVQFNKV